MYRDTLTEPMIQVRKDGDTEPVLAGGGKVIEALYEVPHLAHAPMEPLNATVDLKPDRLDVWIGTQNALGTTGQAARASGLPQEQVYIHNAFLGGGFGRRSNNDEMAQAIAISKEIGRPVKLTWSREQDIRGDRYRPQAAAKFRAVMGADGSIQALEAKVAVGSINRSQGRPVDNGIEGQAVDGIVNSPYKIPNFYVGGQMKNTHLPVSFWRSVGGSQNCFFYESFIDELAPCGRQGPLPVPPRTWFDRKDFVGVLEKLHEASGWETKLPKGRGRGIAVAENHGSVVGTVAEVTISDRDQIRVDRLVVAVDCYHVVNPRSSRPRWNRVRCSVFPPCSMARCPSRQVRCRT
jgi:isoquinoline 1-oxidoreductase beta subunit